MKISGVIWLQRIVDKLASKSDIIPADMTIEEASRFWDTHSVADYPSQVVQLEYTPKERLTFVAIVQDLLAKVEQRARENGVSVETLVNLWIQEKIAL